MDVCMYVNSTASVMVQVIGLATTTFIWITAFTTYES
jgi:hypothetical protein